ncbi:uncharacterized protein PGTG_16327 [Puccinia graminis f. sp. tritici CRL 75-36-700-3]|uniref:Uncharacterized protein n=1 Tax=Puccinia graminis f. sp. tritici (strain CRL 75-36-700-3 / race SCCL) TaxID=418459 RepID=E3L1A6_PUCGT|nr:uncharacterized protein PGTG_16327 [Puccinia graminis f. sp. tritici CRL 75-36-700-3]EFP90301.2 hypothetical protein PGTG_16327 [Puccinia graminis f. sp. tritici CRL 75-36-700-3]
MSAGTNTTTNIIPRFRARGVQSQGPSDKLHYQDIENVAQPISYPQVSEEDSDPPSPPHYNHDESSGKEVETPDEAPVLPDAPLQTRVFKKPEAYLNLIFNLFDIGPWRIDQLGGQTQLALPAPNIPCGHIWHKQFRSYGRTNTVATHSLIPRTPLLLVKGAIDQMDNDWKAAFLPAGYLDNNHDDLVLVNNLIRELLKYEKIDLAKLIMLGARKGRQTKTDAVPSLDRLVIQSPMRVRTGFLLLHMYIQRQQDRTTSKVKSPWEGIDRHLEILQSKSQDYKVAYNKQLFNGIKTATDIAGVEVSLPSEEEVQEMLISGAQAISKEENEADGDLF